MGRNKADFITFASFYNKKPRGISIAGIEELFTRFLYRYEEGVDYVYDKTGKPKLSRAVFSELCEVYRKNKKVVDKEVGKRGKRRGYSFKPPKEKRARIMTECQWWRLCYEIIANTEGKAEADRWNEERKNTA